MKTNGLIFYTDRKCSDKGPVTYEGVIMDHTWKRTWEKATLACWYSQLPGEENYKITVIIQISHTLKASCKLLILLSNWGRVKNMRRDTSTSLQASSMQTVSVALQLDHVTDITTVAG